MREEKLIVMPRGTAWLCGLLLLGLFALLVWQHVDQQKAYRHDYYCWRWEVRCLQANIDFDRRQLSLYHSAVVRYAADYNRRFPNRQAKGGDTHEENPGDPTVVCAGNQP